MKGTFYLFLAVAFCSTTIGAKEPSKSTNFTGNWVLDFGETKNPPAGLQNYSMVVKQDDQQLKVATSLQGDLQATPNTPNPGGSGGGYPGGSGGGYPGGGRRGGVGGGMGIPGVGMGVPGGGMGMPRGGGSRPRSEGPSTQGSLAAYKLYPPSVVYKLDGSESTAQFGDSEQTNATSKAEREKNGQVLKLSLVGNGDTGQGSGKIQVKEQWKLSDDGKTLKVDRSIKSPEGSATVHLVFSKSEADSSGGASPAPQ